MSLEVCIIPMLQMRKVRFRKVKPDNKRTAE